MLTGLSFVSFKLLYEIDIRRYDDGLRPPPLLRVDICEGVEFKEGSPMEGRSGEGEGDEAGV
jgi:hypothetical protein